MDEIGPRNTLATEVAGRIRQMILSGALRPGDPLPARKALATRFHVGVSTVNEAVQALATVGFVQSRAGKGTWVRADALETPIHPFVLSSRLGNADTRDVQHARAVIEVALAELAARRATDQDIEEITAAIAAMEVAENDEAYVNADLRFHLAIANASHNDLLKQFYHLSRKILSELIAELASQPEVKPAGLRIQKQIANAVCNHDPRRARHAAVGHMRHVQLLLERGGIPISGHN